MSLSTGEVTVAGGRSEFEITCTSVTCAGSCEPPGEVETCQNLLLFRKQIDGGPVTLVAQRGHLEPLWADVLRDLKILVDEESKMVVRIPRSRLFFVWQSILPLCVTFKIKCFPIPSFTTTSIV